MNTLQPFVYWLGTKCTQAWNFLEQFLLVQSNQFFYLFTEVPLTQNNHHSAHISLFYIWYVVLNPTRPFYAHGRCSICPAAKDRKTDWKCCQCSEWVCKAIQIKCTIARNNHIREKFHSHLCYKIYFLVLEHFMYFTLYNGMKNLNTSNVLTTIEAINRTLNKNAEKIILKIWVQYVSSSIKVGSFFAL
jgi:hypothetical protein